VTRLRGLLAAACLAMVGSGPADGQTTAVVKIRDTNQVVRLYVARGREPVIVSSGDGGWIHLGPHVAELLAAKGYFVVGVDVRAYLASLTSGTRAVRTEDEPADYQALVDYAARGNVGKPVLIGVSEGAGLSVLAATDPGIKQTVAGVIGLGLPNLNELAWRWRDAIIYVTKGVPNEPAFSTAEIVGRMAPLPLAAIHATHDEFVPVSEVQRVLERAKDPKRLWIVQASNHRFSDNIGEFDERLLEALAWVKSQSGGSRRLAPSPSRDSRGADLFLPGSDRVPLAAQRGQLAGHGVETSQQLTLSHCFRRGLPSDE
jgi:pimeloyl-ACP methyl ester carboxylesterase